MYANILRELPLLRIYILILFGIVIGLHLKLSLAPVHLIIVVGVILSCLLAIRQLYKLNKLRSQIFLVSKLAYILLFLLGISLASRANHANLANTNNQYLTIELLEEATEKEKTYQTIGKVCPDSSKTCFNILLYINKETVQQPLHKGDYIASKAIIQSIPSPLNPYSFDYAQYMHNQGVDARAYLDSIVYLKHSSNWFDIVNKHIYDLQSALSESLERCITNESELAIIKALLLGNKEDINPSLRSSFQNSGAMHILAVSGLHVGIVYLLLSQLLFFMPKKSFLKSLLVIIGICAYALLTGASPSVLRAAIMFSMLTIGQGTKRHINVFNILAASACILSIWNPLIILNIGFQLSYAALVSILFFYKRIYQLYIPSIWLVDKLWQLSAVSIAAQIGTFPLTLFYFHQFPVYFLLSNFVAIPLATLIVYLGITTLVTTALPSLQVVPAKLLSYLLQGLIKALNWIATLPYAISDGWVLSILELLLLYLIILLIMLGVALKRKVFVFLTLIAVLFLCLGSLYQTISCVKRDQIVVYHDKEITSIEFCEGLKSTIFQTDSSNVFLQETIRTGSTYQGIVNQQYHPINTETITFSTDGFSCILIQESLPQNMGIKQTDLLILAHFKQLNLVDLFNRVKAETYVFDGTNNPYLYDDWKQTCASENKSCYFISEQGAYIHQIN